MPSPERRGASPRSKSRDQDGLPYPAPSELPIAAYRDEFVAAVREHQLLIIAGETGSGKTTQIPQYIYRDQPTAKIVITQPRRIAAISNATRVAEEMDTRVGQLVGFAVRFESAISDTTQIRYVTDGVLLREIVDNPNLSNYSVIVIDEAHERTVGTDILLGLLKRCAARRPELKILIMSATLDVKKFSDFFGECPIFQIPGRQYPVEIMYAQTAVKATLQSTYLDRTIDTVLHIHQKEDSGDILAFLTGSQEIERACAETTRRCRKLQEDPSFRRMNVDVVGIYASLQSIDQKAVFRPPRPGCRKIVFATNIAQTSLTIPGIRFVVDCGFVKQNMYDPTTQMDALVVVPISKAAATQRAGRAGRLDCGKAYRLYSHAIFEEFANETTPEIARSSLLDTVLCLKALKIDDVLHFPYVDPPDPDLISAALRQLYYLGAIDDRGHITPLGIRIEHIPLSPFLARALCSAVDEFGCAKELVTIAAMLSVEHIWIEPRHNDERALNRFIACRDRFAHPTGDHMTLLDVFNEWRQHDSSREWCRDHFIHFRAMNQANNIRKQLYGILEKQKASISSCSQALTSKADPIPILRALCTAFFPNLAKRQPGRPFFYQYRVSTQHTESGIMALALHPSSVLSSVIMDDSAANPDIEWVIYHDIIFTNRCNMRHVSRIWNWDWVKPFLPRLESADRAMLNGEAPIVSKASPNATNKMSPSRSSAACANQADDSNKRAREEAIEAARQRALKRRKAM